jgi:hypothetical protein
MKGTYMMDEPLELDLTKETCMASFDRLWAQNGMSIDSASFHTKLDADGKFKDTSFPANASSLFSAG